MKSEIDAMRVERAIRALIGVAVAGTLLFVFLLAYATARWLA